MPPPTTISGGCLCGTVRYDLNFADDPSAWPPKTHTCQCTQCRKRSGALIAPWLTLSTSRVTWFCPPLSTSPSPPPSSSSSHHHLTEQKKKKKENDKKEEEEKKTGSPRTLLFFSEYSASAGHYRGFCQTCGSPLTFRSDAAPDEVEIATGSLDADVLADEGLVGRASEGHFWCKAQVAGVTDLEAGRRWREGEGSEEMGG